MTTTATPTVTASDHRLRTYGLVGAVASFVGAVCAVVIIAWEPMVAEDRFSYPFDAGWFAAWQVVFAVQHAAMLPLFAGLLILERRHPSRALRIGTWVALAGQVALTVLELVAITAADSPLDTGRGAVVGGLYGVPMVLLGLGMVVAGVGALRAGLFEGADRWLPLGARRLRVRGAVPRRVRTDGRRADRDRRVAAGLRGPGPGHPASGTLTRNCLAAAAR